MGHSIIAEVIESADVPVGDLAGEFELVLEPFDGLLVEADLGLDELRATISWIF